jgi:hypothetical protein
MRKPFEPGNTYSTGRPRGARNRLAHKIIEDLSRIWDEPVLPDKEITRGEAALRVMSKQDPVKFVQVYASLVPREMVLSDPTTADLTDEQIEAMIVTLRQQMEESPSAFNTRARAALAKPLVN